MFIIARCNECQKYFDSEDLIYIQPDIGAFCPECHSDDLDMLSEREVLEELNEHW